MTTTSAIPSQRLALCAALEARLRRTLPMARLELNILAACGGIHLALVNHDFPTRPLPQEIVNRVVAQPAYWAFCWGSGLALARYLAAHPERVAGASVIDIGSGSGVVAIAAAKLGAARVTAVDNDPDARTATCTNAVLNGVDITVAQSPESVAEDFDLALMADVLYDRSNIALLHRARALAPVVLLADSRLKVPPAPGFLEISAVEARTTPNLGEFDEFKTAHIYAWSAAPAS